jgi:hypothetical protein
LEDFDLTHLRFGAAYDIGPPLSDLLLITGYGVPPEDQAFKAMSAAIVLGDDKLPRKGTPVPNRVKSRRIKRRPVRFKR